MRQDWTTIRLGRSERERGQSEVVGTILMVGIIVIVISGGAVAVLTEVQSDTGPVADIQASVTGGTLTLAHHGGDELATARVLVVVETAQSRERIAFAEGTVRGSSPDTFGPANKWTTQVSVSPGERVRIVVVYLAQEVESNETKATADGQVMLLDETVTAAA